MPINGFARRLQNPFRITGYVPTVTLIWAITTLIPDAIPPSPVATRILKLL